MIVDQVYESTNKMFEISEYQIDYSENKADLVGKKLLLTSVPISSFNIGPLFTRNDQVVDGVQMHITWFNEYQSREFH